LFSFTSLIVVMHGRHFGLINSRYSFCAVCGLNQLHDKKLWSGRLIACKLVSCVNLNCDRMNDSKLLILHESLNVE